MRTVLRPMRPRWRLLGADAPAHAWEERLPHPSREELRAMEVETAARRVVDRLPSDLATSLATCVAEVWGPRGGEARAHFVLESEDEEQREILLTGPVARLGSGPSCHLVLPDGELAAEHCEISIEARAITVVDLGSEVGTLLNGERLEPHEPSAVTPGDSLELGERRLRVGPIVADEPLPVAVRRQEIRAVSTDPFAHAPGAPALWFPARVGSWRGYVGLTESWIESAYRGLGYPIPPDVGPESPVDSAITTFVLRRLANDFGSRIDRTVEIGEPVAAKALKIEGGDPDDGWLVASFDVVVDGRSRPAVAVWPNQAAPSESTRWTAEIPFTVSVLGGSAALTPAELADLECGDVIVPDHWLAGDESERAAAGPALVALQDWTHHGRIRSAGGRLELELAGAGWRQSPRGEAMIADKNQTGHERRETADAPLDRELEITLAFELDRLAVPLKDLAAWRPGATVSLERSPSDPVKVLLIDGGGTRVVGSGSVVVVEDRLGVRLDEWWPEQEGDVPA